MRFCAVCDNLLYIRVGEEGRGGTGADADDSAATAGPRRRQVLEHVCKCCGHTERAPDTREGRTVYSNLSDDQSAFRQFMTPYVRHDPTLPRVSDVPCPNGGKCTRPADAPQEVLYIKYDARDLRFLYHCCHCGLFWKPAGGGVGTTTAGK